MSMNTDKKISIEERNNLIFYIHEHIDELNFNSKRDILTILKNNLDDSRIKQKGTGTQIQYDDIPNDILIWIYNSVKQV